jgi:hypothetical protein
MSDELNNTVMTLKFTVEQINNMITAMNEPFKTPVIVWANMIAAIQEQCAPQINALNDASGAVSQ